MKCAKPVVEELRRYEELPVDALIRNEYRKLGRNQNLFSEGGIESIIRTPHDIWHKRQLLTSILFLRELEVYSESGNLALPAYHFR